MTVKNYKESYTFWQTSGEEGVPEPAISIEVYGDIICMMCGENSININYESIDELCKLLKSINKQRQ